MKFETTFKPRIAFSRWSLICLSFAVIALMGGCGVVVTQPDFPACIRNAAGNCILLDEVEPIVNDSTLTADEKRQKLRELGIEDEQLIDALINA